MDGKFVVTGGSGSGFRVKSKVAEFTETGAVRDMPSMKTKRIGHACSKFVNDNGDTVSLLYFITEVYINILNHFRLY